MELVETCSGESCPQRGLRFSVSIVSGETHLYALYVFSLFVFSCCINSAPFISPVTFGNINQVI